MQGKTSNEESNNILRINNIQCITLVILYGQFMMHGQRNIKLHVSVCLLKLLRFACGMGVQTVVLGDTL